MSAGANTDEYSRPTLMVFSQWYRSVLKIAQATARFMRYTHLGSAQRAGAKFIKRFGLEL